MENSKRGNRVTIREGGGVSMKTGKAVISMMLSVMILFSEFSVPVWAGESANVQDTKAVTETIPNAEGESARGDMPTDGTEEGEAPAEDTEEAEAPAEDTEEGEAPTEDTEKADVLVDALGGLQAEAVGAMSLYNNSSTVDQEPAALADEPLALSISYPSDIKCGVPVTFTMNAAGGTGNYKYRIAALMDSELVSVYDISYGSNGSYGDSNQFTFTFYASGTYYIRFSVMDMTTYQTKTTGLYEYPIVIQDASHPSVEQIVTDIAAQCEAVCTTDFEKALWLHDWIIDHADYDYSYSYCSAEGVLARGVGTCESYHKAYVKLLNKVCIETGRIEGNGHVWTAVKMDGEWYQIDSTWDDMGASYKGTYYEHMYFGLTDYIIGLVHDDHKAAVPGYESTALEDNYFIKTGQIAQWSDPFVDTIKQNLADGKTEFTLLVTSSMPDSYKNVIYNLVAYQLSKQKWDNKELSVSYANGQLTCQVVKAGIEISANGNSTETTYTLTVRNAVSPGGVKNVRFAVWSQAGGQDDLIWYTATKNASGDYTANVPISNHKTDGTYYADVYVTDAGGTVSYIGGTIFEVSLTAIKSIQVTNKNEAAGQFDVILTGVSAKSGVSKVQVPVWSQSDQSDLIWYTATRQNDGSYKMHVDLANHNYNYGSYYVDVYVTSGNGVRKYVGGTKVAMNRPKPEIKVSGNAQETRYTATVSNAAMAGGIKSMAFAVWSQDNGQDDLKWYTATKASDGAWTANIEIANHRTSGLYYVDAYAKNAADQNIYMGGATFQISGVTAGTITVGNKNEGTGRFNVTVSGIKTPSGVNTVSVPVWSKSDQSDLHWYTATKQSDGSYVAKASISNHNYNYGKYYADVYVVTGNGIRQYVGGKTVTMSVPRATVTATANSNQTKYSLTASSVGIAGGVKSVRFAVWSQTNGQDDLIWYNAANTAPGTWTVDMAVVNHKTAGLYYVDTYVQSAAGKSIYIGGITFKVSAPTASSVKLVNYNKTAGTFGAQVMGVQSVAGIASVKVAVWSASDQSDLVWYDATATSSGTYQISADIRKHKNHTGRYYADAYITDKNGIRVYVGGVTCSM